MDRLLIGTVAGITATTAMTAAMAQFAGRRSNAERDPLPPRHITEGLLERADVQLDERSWRTASLASHFVFGATAGAVYATLAGTRSWTSGVAYALGIWAASYLGWVPALGIPVSAKRQSVHRNALMLGVHVLWGGVLALSIGGLEASERMLERRRA